MTKNTEAQLAEALDAMARQLKMQLAAKSEKTIHETIDLLEKAAQAVREDSASLG